MKKLIVSLIIILALLVSGCETIIPDDNNGVIIPVTDEEKVEDVVSDYISALSNEDWSKAKSLCLIGSDMYNETSELQAIIEALDFYYSWNWTILTIDSFVDGNYAEVYFDAIVIAVIEEHIEEGLKSDVTCFLQKVGNDWKIYRSENLW